MPLRFGINGLGRIGRALLRLTRDHPDLELAAVNDVVDAPMLARLLARDTIHGPFPGAVAGEPGALVVDGRRIPVLAEPDPARIPWTEAAVQVVVEATGRFARRDLAAPHLGGTVERVIVSANAPEVEATFCLGVNDSTYDPRAHAVVSNASCTTNCLALTLKVIHDAFGVRGALVSTVHPYTENQRLLDGPHAEPRRARAAGLNMIPTPTTAARAVGLVIPDLRGKIEGFGVRVPTAAVALLDVVAELERPAPADALRDAYRAAAAGPLGAVLAVAEEELVSSDFVGDPHSAIVDLPLVQSLQTLSGGLSRVVAWYDNEWGYANRLRDLLAILARGR
jgi:glyceraldehyde 3-phosphate dehydrogenase